MAILFSKEFNIPIETIDELGVFNVFLDEDSHFFINIKRLQATSVCEFIGAYDKINDYFRMIGMLLKNSKSDKDRLYQEAFKRFDFPEVNGINLGFSEGCRGAGFGFRLRKQIIKDAHEIIMSGSEQPEIFHLVGLFEENVGPDRLSDMIARLIYTEIVAYSKRIYRELNITPHTYPNYQFVDEIPINPYKHIELLLLPTDILHELPIAKCWDDIDRVCRENIAIRKEINSLISSEWSKMASSEKKRYIKDWIFKNPERTKRIVDSYIESTVDSFDLLTDVDYLIGYLKNTYNISPIMNNNSFEVASEIVTDYKEWVEYHRGANIIQNAAGKEKTVQRTFHAVALMYCKKFNWDINPEEDCGRGPVDFKISRGIDKTVLEIKLTSNPNCVHGLEVQLEEYAKAEDTSNKIFILVNTGHSEERIRAVYAKRDEMLAKGMNPAKIVVIDSKIKDSASTYKP